MCYHLGMVGIISNINSYLMAGSGFTPRKAEQHAPSSGSAKGDALKSGPGVGSGMAIGPSEASEAIQVGTAGVVPPGSTGLFADVSGLNGAPDIPQMVVLEKGFEASLQAFRSREPAPRQTIDTFA